MAVRLSNTKQSLASRFAFFPQRFCGSPAAGPRHWGVFAYQSTRANSPATSVPTTAITLIQARVISANITAYSVAVGPSTSRANCLAILFRASMRFSFYAPPHASAACGSQDGVGPPRGFPVCPVVTRRTSNVRNKAARGKVKLWVAVLETRPYCRYDASYCR